MAEGARLESVYTATYRGFESPPHRHHLYKSAQLIAGHFYLYILPTWGDENPRLGVRQLAHARWTAEPATLPAG